MKYVAETKPGLFYYRRSGRYWGRLPGRPGSSEFAREYEKIDATFRSPGPDPAIPGTFGAMAEAYLASAEFTRNLKPKTRTAYRHDLDLLRRTFGKHRVEEIHIDDVLELRDIYSNKPGKANTLLRTMRVLFQWGMVRRLARDNPADLKAHNVKALKMGEHRPWAPGSLAKFRAEGQAHLVLAMELALWTGQRQGDLIRMRWDDIRGGMLRVVQEKTGKELWLPMAQPLIQALERAPKIALTILVSSKNRPWLHANPLAQAFGDELRRLKLAERFHGLRKTTAVVLAEAGCTTKQVAAITGQSDQMVSHYTRTADRSRLAQAAVVKLELHMRESVNSGSGEPQKPEGGESDENDNRR